MAVALIQASLHMRRVQVFDAIASNRPAADQSDASGHLSLTTQGASIPASTPHPSRSAHRTSRLSLFVSLFALLGPLLFFRVPQVSPPTSRVAILVTLCRLFAHPPSGAAGAITCKVTALALHAPLTPHLDARLVAKSESVVAKSDDAATSSGNAVAKSAEVRAGRQTS